ncbi:MAG: hypothetical protein PHW40_07535 [Candidatus Izemoplasmatales bacterium]|nr:hypothetical protein [Candidatus Izemoplasmatales bacterium]
MDIRTLTAREHERMTASGWMRRTVRDDEMPAETVARYEEMGYDARAYRVTTSVRGFYRYIVMIRRTTA